jgi:hypothetical protein
MYSKDIKEGDFLKFKEAYSRSMITRGNIYKGEILQVHRITSLESGKKLNFWLIKVKDNGSQKSQNIAKNVAFVNSYVLDTALQTGVVEVARNFKDLKDKEVSIEGIKDIIKTAGLDTLTDIPMNKMVTSGGANYIKVTYAKDEKLINIIKPRLLKAFIKANIEYQEHRYFDNFVYVLKNQ